MPRHSTRPRSAPPRTVPLIDDLPPDQQERRARIIDAAVVALLSTDYGDIQVKDVAGQAGVALGTLYRYFASKDHLMACALLEWSSGFPDATPATTDVALVDRVKATYRRAALAFERQPRVFDAVMQLQVTQDPHAAAVFAEFSARRTATFADALAGTPADLRDDIVDIMSAVLAESLRSAHLGLRTRSEVARRLDRTAELLVPH